MPPRPPLTPRALRALRRSVLPCRRPLQCLRYSTSPPPPPPPAPRSPPASRPYSTPLAKQLTEAIKTTGPIPLASYMRQCLTSDSAGYYTGERDPFGHRGDFVTSPEISQMFGEMLAVWVVAEWMRLGPRPGRGVQIVELGPGRGTLMEDVLRTLSSFRRLMDAVESVYLIEASPHLRKTQHERLCPPDSTLSPTADGRGFSAPSKYGRIPITWYTHLSHVPRTTTTTTPSSSSSSTTSSTTSSSPPSSPPSSPSSSPSPPTPAIPFILAHEFFDALPIHAFESTPAGWRELLVTPTPPTSTHRTLSTPRSSVLSGAPVPEFALVLASAPTPHSLLLPELSPRYQALSRPAGNIIEVSPDALVAVEEMAERVGSAGGGAGLIVDYGPEETVPVNSLRGIRNHRVVSPFERPGETDVSADVDFGALAERALARSEAVEVHGPVQQGAFLRMMGMRERLAQLVRGLEKGGRKEGEGRKGGEGRKKGEGNVEGRPGGPDVEKEKRKRDLEKSFNRLVDTGVGGMGKVYKVLAIVPERGGKRPVGFGGEVQV